MIGPDPVSMRGGVSSVIASLSSSETLNCGAVVEVLPTVRAADSSLGKFIFMGRQLLHLAKTYDRSWICHIHICSGISCWRKIAFLRVAQSKGMKTVLHLHGAEFKEFYASLPWIGKKLVRRAFRSADAVIALSNSWRLFIEDVLGAEKVNVVHNSIDCEKYQSALGEKGRMVFLGELCSRKGVYDLVEALARVSTRNVDFQCLLAGNGEIEEVEELIARRGISEHVKCTGWVDRSDARMLLQSSAIQLLPSYNEGFPVSLVEGMACGNAIIASDIPGVKEAVSDEGAILVPPGEVEALAASIERLLLDPDLVACMCEANRAHVERECDDRTVHRSLLGLYEALGGRGA